MSRALRAAVAAGLALALVITGVAAGQAEPEWGTAAEADIRAAVDDVLSRPAYGASQRGVWGWLTDNPVARFIEDLWDRFVRWLNSLFPDPEPPEAPGARSAPDAARATFAVALIGGLVLLAALVALRLARRRVRDEESVFAADPGEALSRDDLLDTADRAEQAGDHEAGVRLRFKAGLLTLDRRGVIAYDEARPLGTVRREVDDGEFDHLADGFERVTYSDHVATASDSTMARDGWRRLLGRLGR